MPIHGFHFRFPDEADVDRSSLLANRDANDPTRTSRDRVKPYLDCKQVAPASTSVRSSVASPADWLPTGDASNGRGSCAGRWAESQDFISYLRKDMAFADRIEAALKARGFEPLIDRTEI
jgi:hypothetical protein